MEGSASHWYFHVNIENKSIQPEDKIKTALSDLCKLKNFVDSDFVKPVVDNKLVIRFNTNCTNIANSDTLATKILYGWSKHNLKKNVEDIDKYIPYWAGPQYQLKCKVKEIKN